MKIVTVLGARPQFIKAAPLCRALREAGHQEILVHTGQHYDASMSEVFFREMGIPEPTLNLNVGSGPHGMQTGIMLQKIEQVLVDHKPDWTLVFGDTNSTLAGALAACKLMVPVAHVEAGLRSFNRSMPEEHNRVLTDHCSDLLFCPTETAVKNLREEGIQNGVHRVGDTMLDAVQAYAPLADLHSRVLEILGLQEKSFYLATIHRPYNTDARENLDRVLQALGSLRRVVVLPLHPRTKARIAQFALPVPRNVMIAAPVGYLDMLRLQKAAKVVLTDSGGVQKEACFLGTPCVTLRSETEWIETVQAGWNRVVGTGSADVAAAVEAFENHELPPPLSGFGDGQATIRIAQLLGTAGPQVRDAAPC